MADTPTPPADGNGGGGGDQKPADPSTPQSPHSAVPKLLGRRNSLSRMRVPRHLRAEMSEQTLVGAGASATDSPASVDWNAIHKKLYTRWANACLAQRLLTSPTPAGADEQGAGSDAGAGGPGTGQAYVIKDLYTDLSDGIVLCRLLEVVGRSTLRYHVPTRNQFDVIENISVAFAFLREHGCNLLPTRDAFVESPNEVHWIAVVASGDGRASLPS